MLLAPPSFFQKGGFMLLVEIGRDGSRFEMGESPQWFEVERDRKTPLRDRELCSLLSGRYVGLGVPGYNTDQAQDSLLAIAEETERRKAGILLAVDWPGSIKPGFWWGLYRARQSGAILAGELLRILCMVPSLRLWAQGHSAGCELLYTLAWKGVPLEALVLCGAAMGREFRYCRSMGRAGVAFSGSDRVLKWAYFLAMGFQRALGEKGLEREIPGVAQIDLTGVVTEHSGYRHCREYLDFLFSLVGKEGE